MNAMKFNGSFTLLTGKETFTKNVKYIITTDGKTVKAEDTKNYRMIIINILSLFYDGDTILITDEHKHEHVFKLITNA